MKKLFSIILGGLAIAGLPSHSFAKVNIFACEPEWKALAEEIGGDNIEAISATSALQDAHHLRAKPSLIAKMRQANLVFCSGSDLEVGWLPVLLQKSGSEPVQQGKTGYLMASDYVNRLGVPDRLDRSEGDIHPQGNPHIQTDPRNLVMVADELAKRLAEIDSTNSEIYQSNLAKFKSEWTGYIKYWQNEASHLKGLPVLVQHSSFKYLANWLDLNVLASLEPKPGVSPTVSHLESLLKLTKEQKPKAILLAPHESKEGAEWLSERTGIPVVILPFTVGGSNDAETLKTLFDDTMNKLSEIK